MRNLDSCRCCRCTLCPCKVRNKFLVNFWNRTILLCIPCISSRPSCALKTVIWAACSGLNGTYREAQKSKCVLGQWCPKMQELVFCKIIVISIKLSVFVGAYCSNCLEFRWDGSLVSAIPLCGSGIVCQNRVCYSHTARFPTAVSKTECSAAVLC